MALSMSIYIDFTFIAESRKTRSPLVIDAPIWRALFANKNDSGCMEKHTSFPFWRQL
jgi:hypothetical protein